MPSPRYGLPESRKGDVGRDYVVSAPLGAASNCQLGRYKAYPVSISEDFDRFNDSVAEFYRERGIDILVSATTAAQFERYLTRENGLALTVGVPALGQFNPLTEFETMAAKDSVSVPICLVSLKGRKAPAYAASSAG